MTRGTKRLGIKQRFTPQGLMHDMDARDSELLGQELYQLIVDSVAASQRFLLVTLPDRLIVTQKQFASLNNFTEEMYETSDRLFRTPLNVMEVIIDREVDKVQDIDDIIEGVEQMVKAEEGTDEQIN